MTSSSAVQKSSKRVLDVYMACAAAADTLASQSPTLVVTATLCLFISTGTREVVAPNTDPIKLDFTFPLNIDGQTTSTAALNDAVCQRAFGHHGREFLDALLEIRLRDTPHAALHVFTCTAVTRGQGHGSTFHFMDTTAHRGNATVHNFKAFVFFNNTDTTATDCGISSVVLRFDKEEHGDLVKLLRAEAAAAALPLMIQASKRCRFDDDDSMYVGSAVLKTVTNETHKE